MKLKFDDEEYSIQKLASKHSLNIGTLYARIQRFGATATGVSRALATGVMSKSDIGRAVHRRCGGRFIGYSS